MVLNPKLNGNAWTFCSSVFKFLLMTILSLMVSPSAVISLAKFSSFDTWSAKSIHFYQMLQQRTAAAVHAEIDLLFCHGTLSNSLSFPSRFCKTQLSVTPFEKLMSQLPSEQPYPLSSIFRVLLVCFLQAWVVPVIHSWIK